MDTKECSKCNQNLSIDNFYKKKGGKMGLASRCKKCENKRTQEWAKNNRDKRNKSYKKWHNSKVKPKTRKFKQQKLLEVNKKECSQCNKELNINEFYKEERSSDGLMAACKACLAERGARWAKENKEKVREKSRRHRNKSVENLIHARMSNAIWYCLRDEKRNSSWLNYVNYSVNDLKERLESQFTEGMSWEKFMSGEIHIDHITPKSWFNFTSPEDEEFIKCWSLDNLQPLWRKENISKGNRYEG